MRILLPSTGAAEWRERLDHITRTDTLAPFSPVAMEFVAAASRRLLSDRTTGGIPEFAALGHWMRKAHIIELHQIFAALPNAGARLARGLAVHFAPGNVDSLFVYSWFLSLLVGNSNIVRLPSSRDEQSRLLLEVLGQVLEDSEFERVRDRTLVVSYEHDDLLTAEICRTSHVRVIWGGDTAVRNIRNIEMNPLGTEIVFPDRFAVAVLDADAVLGSDEKTFARLVHGFFADAFWFHQLACSSPRLVLWVGSMVTIERAKRRFWPALEAECRTRGVCYPEAIGMRRMTSLYAYAAAGQVDSVSGVPTALATRGHLAKGVADFREGHCGGGFFLEQEMESLNDLTTIAHAKDQTMTHFGFSEAELRTVAAHLPVRAVDRIVPVGKALQFSHVWDGINLLNAFTREVVIEVERQRS